MTVSTTSNRVDYDGTGAISVYSFPFRIFSTSDLVVIERDTAGNETTLTLGVGYTATGISPVTGGTVTRLAGNLPAGYHWTIKRVLSLLQPTDLRNQKQFFAETHETAFDRLTMQLQQIAEAQTRMISVGETDAVPAKLPPATVRANKGSGFDSSGNLTVFSGFFTGLPSVSVTQVVNTVAALKALAVPSSADTYLVRGYSAIGDGGGGVFRWDSADTTADNLTLNVQPNSGGIGRWRRLYEGNTVHISWWGNSLANATTYMPTSSILQLGAGPYTGMTTVNRSDITIRGVGMPFTNGAKTGLTGGTIIQGKLAVNGHRVTIESLGIDCGSAVCTALNGGVAMDALAFLDPARSTLQGCVVRDVATICQSPTAAVHNFLLEGHTDARFENLHARYGWWGVVLKVVNSTADGLYAYGCSQAGFTFKSDVPPTNGMIALKSTVSNVVVFADDYPTAVQCILIYAASSSISDLALTNYYCEGGVEGLKLVCDTRAASVNLIKNVAISNGCIRGQTTYGFTSFGAVADISVSNLTIEGVVSNNSIKVWSDCLGINFSNVTASAPTASTTTSVDLAGRFSFDGLRSFVNGDYLTPAGINCVPDSRGTMKIGAYIGTLNMSGTAAGLTLLNTWTAFAATPCGIRVQSGRAQLYGRVAVPSLAWTGKEVIGTIPANLAPATAKYFMIGGFDTGNKMTPIYVTVNVNGNITADFLNTASSFPTTITHLNLDALSWLIPE
jgi:hypothetical protein